MTTLNLTVDGIAVTVPAGATILDAAKVAGISIPTLCHFPGLPSQTSCLVCVVKVNNGTRLLPSCATKAAEGMAVDSSSTEVHDARRTALELLLGYHLGDCLAPCESICPTHFDVAEVLRLAAAWRLEEAIAVMLERHALPAILGRLCPNLCERGCRRTMADGAVSVREVERFVADADLNSANPYIPPLKPASGRKVAIIGAGPCGLSAAFHLARFGHACTVFDASIEVGGALRREVSVEALPRTVIDAEVARIKRMGVTFQLGTAIDADIFARLRSEYHAVLVATGEANAKVAAVFGLTFAGKGLKAERDTGATAIPGVFTAGSAVAPAKQAVRAVASGRGTALAINRYLAGLKPEAEAKAFSVRLGPAARELMPQFLAHASASPRHEPVPGGCLDDDETKDESARCLACACTSRNNCSLRDYADEYGADPNRFRMELPPLKVDYTHPLVTYEPGKCIACGLCIAVAAQHGEKLGLGFAGRGFTIQVAVPFGGTMKDALPLSARKCAEVCPTAAIALRPDAVVRTGVEAP